MKNTVNKKNKNTSEKNTRDRILDISAELFSKRGYNGTSLRILAELVNIKAGSLYHHFDSKEQLVTEVLVIGVNNILDNVINHTNELPKNASTRALLVSAAKGHLEALHEKGDYTSTSIRNYGQLPEPVKKKVLKIRDKYERLWKGWLEEAAKKGEIKSEVDLKILRLTILGALNRTLEWYKKGEYSIEEIAEMQIGIIWDGCKKERDK